MGLEINDKNDVAIFRQENIRCIAKCSQLGSKKSAVDNVLIIADTVLA